MAQQVFSRNGKELYAEYGGKQYARIPVKTHLITDKDTMQDVLKEHVVPQMQAGDVVFISEKAVACTQKRAIPMDEIQPSFPARILCKFVYKNPYGIGLALPETMEMAIQEVGLPRILLAAAASCVGKVIGKRGWFYQVAGEKARGIDGPCDCTLPPYDNYVVLVPDNPDQVAQDAADQLHTPVAIVDANDLGVNILGLSKDAPDIPFLQAMLQDNPLGQGSEQTPIGLIREA